MYDTSVLHSTFSTRFGFVCDDFYLKGIYQSVVMGGMLAGSFAGGLASDRFGRRTVILAGILLVWIFGILNAFVTSRLVFGISQFLIGMSAMGVFMTSYVLIAESTIPK